VTFADTPEDQLALIEDRLVHAAIEDVAAHHDGVVVVHDIAFVDIIAEKLSDRLHRWHQATQVNRNILPLQDHFCAVIEERVAVVMRYIEDAGASCFFQRQGHFALGSFQHTAYHCKRDRIDFL
jgi:hypothetical protein